MNRIVSYTVGLILALALTVVAFSLVFAHTQTPGLFSSALLITIIIVLAMVQLTVQLVFFLHFGQGEDSRWDSALFCFTFFGILVVVLASVWIMGHLNYNMTPTQIDQYITNQSGF